MTLTALLVFILASLLIAVLTREVWRRGLLLVISILAIYWLQPSMPIRHLDYWLPTFSLVLAIVVWALTRPAPAIFSPSDMKTAGGSAGLIILVGLLRYLEPVCCLTPTRPPALPYIILVLTAAGLVVFLLARYVSGKAGLLKFFVLLIVALFILLKTEFLAQAASVGLRTLTGQPIGMASSLDLHWLGFSYIAFRLIHTLRDRLSGRLPECSLQDYIIYIIFFPSFTAGPIDRVQRFIQDLDQPYKLSASSAFQGGKRIAVGVFCKFVLADGLALISLNANYANQTTNPGWLWVMLYAYALRIYFDFSGYTDIAIGLGRLMGIQLPENFMQPYRKSNLTSFWNNWHITLAQWFRAYFFNPFTRALRTNPRKLPMPLIIFLGQVSSMLLIGLWHGVTWNFAAWGLWHGVGLFLHNRWSELLRSRQINLEQHPRLLKAIEFTGVLFTFHFVTLGWVWFALPSIKLSWRVFLQLFGLV